MAGGLLPGHAATHSLDVLCNTQRATRNAHGLRARPPCARTTPRCRPVKCVGEAGRAGGGVGGSSVWAWPAARGVGWEAVRLWPCARTTPWCE
jgi:hypothetical protein